MRAWNSVLPVFLGLILLAAVFSLSHGANGGERMTETDARPIPLLDRDGGRSFETATFSLG